MAYEPADIEKKSLEAHVELCAERYSALEAQLDNLTDSIKSVNNVVCDVRDTVAKMAEKRNDQLLAWGLGLISLFAGSTVWLLVHYVLK